MTSLETKAEMTKFLGGRVVAAGYGATVGVAGVVLSYLLLLPQLYASDHWPWISQAWMLVVMPATFVIGLLSAFAYDWIQGDGRDAPARIGLFVINVTIVAVLPHLVVLVLNWYAAS